MTTGSSRHPSLILDATDAPVVAWAETTGSATDIRLARFDSGSGSWVAIGDSLSAAGGISQSGTADRPQLAVTGAELVVAWLDSASGTPQVRASRFTGSTWTTLGAGTVTSAPTGVSDYRVASDGTRIAVAWTQANGAQADVYAREFNGATWLGLAGSDTGGGISANSGDSREPTVAYYNGNLFVAWRDQASGFEQIYAKRYDGSAWSAAGTGAASGGGVSATTRMASAPSLAAAGGRLYLTWMDRSAADRFDPHGAIYVKAWDGSAFAEQLPGDASGPGIQPTGGKLDTVSLAVDAAGRPTIAWIDSTSGTSQLLLRSVTQQAGRVFVTTPAAGIQSVLDGNTLGVSDVILLQSGTYAGFTLRASDAGVLILGAPGYQSTVSGLVTVEAGAGGILQRLTLSVGVTATGSSGLTLVDSVLGGPLTLAGTTDLQVLHNRFSVTGTGIAVTAAGQGLIAHNDIAASGTGLALTAPWTGQIRDNAIHGGVTGVAYSAAAVLDGNRIYGNTMGVSSTVGGTTNGFGFVGSSRNEIYNNTTGVTLINAQMQNQHVYGNVTGVSGSGVLGGADFEHANLIESNTTGVNLTGPIQFNRIARNTVGIAATSGQLIAHNLIYRNTGTAVQVTGKNDVRIVSNTFYTPQGDNIRISGSSTQVEVRDNILWAESGYDLYVANDSQGGFFSDYNNLYASGTGTLLYWTKDFTDILDWQADVAAFDLHSIGHTAVNPRWAEPRFVNRAQDDYRIFAEVAGQRFSSPTVDAGDPRTDQALKPNSKNLLLNPSFENGVSNWVTNTGCHHPNSQSITV